MFLIKPGFTPLQVKRFFLLLYINKKPPAIPIVGGKGYVFQVLRQMSMIIIEAFITALRPKHHISMALRLKNPSIENPTCTMK